MVVSISAICLNRISNSIRNMGTLFSLLLAFQGKGGALQVTSVPKKPVNVSVKDLWNSDMKFLNSPSATVSKAGKVQFLNCSIEKALKKSYHNTALPIVHSFKLL